MKVGISKITSVTGKLSDITSGDKTIPGLLLDLSENLLKVCYNDNHKAFIEKLEVETEEGDFLGQIVVDFGQFARAIASCQPSGIIKVSDITFKYNTDRKILTITTNQLFENKDADGNVLDVRELGKKSMDLVWADPSSSIKTSILTRMKYDDIFNGDNTDEFDKKEMLDALTKTSAEKDKTIYFSNKMQTVFASNQTHVVSVPISKLKELTTEEVDVIRMDVRESKEYTDDAEFEKDFKAAVAKAENRIHYSLAIPQSIAKAIIGVFGKTTADTVYLYTKDKFCNIFVDTDTETVGMWFEMAVASKIHISALDKYYHLGFKSYQTLFLREFIENIFKSALNNTKSEKLSIKFEKLNNENVPSLIVLAGSASSSIADTYSVKPIDLIDPQNNIESKTFNISLKTFTDMLSRLKTPYIAMDFDVAIDGTVCVRLSDIDEAQMGTAYMIARQKTEQRCKEQGIEFVATETEGKEVTPTPVEFKLEMRDLMMKTKEFTLLGK